MEARTRASRSRRPGSTLASIFLGAGVSPLLLAFAAHRFFHGAHVSASAHEAIELIGSCVALGVAGLLLLRARQEKAPPHLLWIVAALVGMGLLDGVHAVLREGAAWSWLRHGATFVGGALFGLVRLPVPALVTRRSQLFVATVAVVCVALALSVWRWPGWWPAPWVRGADGLDHYTLPVKLTNLLGGTGFLSAAVFFGRRYLREPRADDLVFAAHTLLFGVASLFFGFSERWAADWWTWHAFRLLAYLVVLSTASSTVVSLYRQAQRHAQDMEAENAERRRAEAAVQRERQRLYDVLETLPAMVCLLTPDHHVTFANRSFREKFGDADGRPCHEYCFGRAAPCEFCESYRVLETGEPHRWEVKAPDGAIIDAYDFPFSDVDGSPLILEMDIDITARKQAEAALRQINDTLEQRVAERTAELRRTEGKYRDLFDTTSDGVWLHDLEGRLLEVNEAYCRMSGYSRDEIVGRPVSTFEAAEPPDEIAAHLRSFLEGGGHDRFESRHRRKDGTTFDVEITALYLEREKQIAILARDITDRKRLEAEREQHLAAIEEANEAKNLFFNTLSHELRTPLAAMVNALEIVRREEATPDQRTRAVGILDRNLRHQTRLIEDLLDLSRIMRGKVELERGPVDLRELVTAAIEAVEGAARQARLKLRLAPSPAPVPVLADPVRLGQVISNLLTNAIKFTPAEGQITATVAREGGEAVVAIRDTGVGISPEVLPHLFVPFRQAETSLARTKGGLGIGLAVARSLAELHGGTLKAKSAGLGRGSEFTLRLPVHEAGSRTTASPVARAEAAQPRRVLLIEDNADLRDSLAMLLVMMGHVTFSAADGAAGIELARKDRPDTVLVDIGLPDMDGYELARRLRADAATRDLRLIALTGYATPEHRTRALEAGFNDHVAKPVDAEVLQQLLGRDRLRP